MSELIHLSPMDAHRFLQENTSSLLIDVRSSMEYLFVGHPIGAMHVAWIDEPDWEINPQFATEVEHTLSRKLKTLQNIKQEAHVVLICRSGNRTQDAADLLLKAGFQHIYHINEGFEGERDESHHRGTTGGWRFHGLPWEQC